MDLLNGTGHTLGGGSADSSNGNKAAKSFKPGKCKLQLCCKVQEKYVKFLEYHPLMGSGSSSNYRPTKKSKCGGGGCGK